jgi:hypothetical protein
MIMKNLKSFLRFIFALVLGASFLLTSCSKEDELVAPTDQPTWSVRPDFATLDTRPQAIIEQFTLTEKDATPVELSQLKAGGKYALVIGISNYSGTANDLEYCDDDANDWKALLLAEGYSVNLITDLQATKSNIESAVNTLASQSIAGNEIVFCYSGHGSKGSIVSTDLYFIPSTWFKTKFSNAKSTKMMFCFDACQIGAMGTDLNATGRIIVLASSKTTYSYDGDATMKNGVFTYYQMLGFNSPVSYIYVEDDSQYAIDGMKSWATKNHVKVAPSFVDSYTNKMDL